MTVVRVLGRQAGAALGVLGHDLELDQHTTSAHKARFPSKWPRGLRLQVDGTPTAPIPGRVEWHLRRTLVGQSHVDGGHRPRAASRPHTVVVWPPTFRRRLLPWRHNCHYSKRQSPRHRRHGLQRRPSPSALQDGRP